MAVRVLAIVFAALLAIPTAGSARSRSRRLRHRPPATGRFDYWVLSLSWSPEHCAERSAPPDDTQCAAPRRYGFIAHGLWPQYEGGGYPETCRADADLPPAVIEGLLDIMPSRDLIRHEWQKHGTCSGLAADAYFGLVQRAFRATVIPPRYQHPDAAFRVTAASVRKEIGTVNAAIPGDGIAVLCRGHFLTEVRLCLSRDDLSPRACGRGIRDSCDGEVTVRPLR